MPLNSVGLKADPQESDAVGLKADPQESDPVGLKADPQGVARTCGSAFSPTRCVA
jgi:hypothetical protein